MKIFVAGIRGIPHIPGGIEKHCEELYPRIAALGHDVLLATRRPYVVERRSEWRRVGLVNLLAPRLKSLEAIVHTFLAVIYARLCRPDVVHLHAVGPALMTPLARLLGMRVVFTHHGPDYDREKWNRLAKGVLRFGECCGSGCAHERIVISKVIEASLRAQYHCHSNLVPNGVSRAIRTGAHDYLDRLGLVPGRYVLAVARFVPEKGLHDLMDAFQKIDYGGRLVLAGDADHESDYSRELKKQARGDDRIVLTGYITGAPLQQVFSNAGLFVLPSYHEGLPIALLEALSYGIPVLASDIPANKEIGLPPHWYFRCRSITDLQRRMQALIARGMSAVEKQMVETMLAEKYDWDGIAAKTVQIYHQVLAGT